MSISLSLYDVFSNIVPGLIYLFVLNEILQLFGKSQIDLLQALSGQILFIVLIAFVLGQLFSTFTYEGWYRLFVKRSEDKLALEKTISRFPELNINFKPTDTELLLSFIQSRDKAVAERIEGFRANAIMIRNIILIKLNWLTLCHVMLSTLPTKICPLSEDKGGGDGYEPLHL